MDPAAPESGLFLERRPDGNCSVSRRSKKALAHFIRSLSRAVYRARTAAVLQGLSINERALSSSSAKEIETVERQQQQASRSTNYKYTNKFNLAP